MRFIYARKTYVKFYASVEIHLNGTPYFSLSVAIRFPATVMKEGLYGLIFGMPMIVIFVVMCAALTIMENKGINVFHLVATYAFSSIIEKKTDSNGVTRWLLKDIVLEDELLSDIFRGLFSLFLMLIFGILSMFFQLLLIDVSYSCDLEDKRKDCFEFKLWDTKRFSNDPINCSSAAIQNGTVDVICYKIVFNAGLAMGASYGAFKISVAAINLAAAGLLMIKQTKTICKVRAVLAFLYLGVLVAIIAVQFTTLRVFLVSDTLANALQAIVTLGIGCVFVLYIPWKDLILLKNAQNEQATPGIGNIALEDLE